MITIGILNLQGAVSEHYDITKKAIENMGIEAEAISVRNFTWILLSFWELFWPAVLLI